MKSKRELHIIFVFVIGFLINLNAQWTNPSSFTGVVKTFLKVDSLTILAGTNMGDIYISKNLGANWKVVTNNIPSSNIYCFLSFGNKIFTGTDNGCFISTDKGSRWSKENWVLNGKAITCLINEGNNIMACTKRRNINFQR